MFRSPSSPKYVKYLAKKLLAPIQRGESAFIRWFPGHGKTALLNQILTDKILMKENLGEFYKRFIFIRIDGYIFSSLSIHDFFINVLETLDESLRSKKPQKRMPKILKYATHSYIFTLKNIIDSCNIAIKDNYEIVFVLDAIDEFPLEKLKELFIAWESIIENNRTRTHLLTNITKRDILDKCLTQSGLIQNLVFISLPDKSECQYFQSFYKSEWKMNISSDTFEYIQKTCGHDPVLLKEALRIFSHNKSQQIDLLLEPTLLLKAKIDYEQLGEKEREVIEQKLNTDKILPNLRKTANELVFANFWDKNYHISPIVTHAILENKKISNLYIDSQKDILFFGNINLSQKLSSSEYSILKILLLKKGRTVTRDEIAEVMWGKKMIDLYSDWAIDKAISRLRYKIRLLTSAYQIQTRKKEGFLLEE